jgi:hypothetical protein
VLGISDQSIYTWRRQDRIDRGLEPGLTSTEKAELVAAKRTFRNCCVGYVASARAWHGHSLVACASCAGWNLPTAGVLARSPMEDSQARPPPGLQ